MGVIAEFKTFLTRGNFIDMAVGFTVGAGFTTVVKSAVEDVVMPPIGLAVGRVDFSERFVVLRQGVTAEPYHTIKQAKEAGAVTLNYGNFVNTLIALFIVAAVMFLIVRLINRMHTPPKEPDQKKCPYCATMIAFAAVRCPSCTTELDGFDERRQEAVSSQRSAVS